MRTTIDGINFLKSVEGCKLKAYLCPAKKWTIGYGNTYYEDGTLVKQGDVITQERAEQLLLILLPKYEKPVNTLVKKQLTQNQFNALVSFVWNEGATNFTTSTLLTLINKNPKDPLIEGHFIVFNKIRDPHTNKLVICDGLTNRRKKEWLLYNSK